MKVFPWGHLDARLGKGQTVARLGRGQSDARLERGQDTEDFLLAAHRGVDWSQKHHTSHVLIPSFFLKLPDQ